MQLPDYEGAGIVNLLSSIITGLDGEPTGYAPCNDLPSAELSDHRNVVLIVLDGLGYEFLMRQDHGRFFGSTCADG